MPGCWVFGPDRASDWVDWVGFCVQRLTVFQKHGPRRPRRERRTGRGNAARGGAARVQCGVGAAEGSHWRAVSGFSRFCPISAPLDIHLPNKTE